VGAKVLPILAQGLLRLAIAIESKCEQQGCPW